MKHSALCYAEGSSSTGLGHLYRVLSIFEKYSFKIEFTFIVSNSTQKKFFKKFKCEVVSIETLDTTKSFKYGIYDSKKCKIDLFYKLKPLASKWIAIDSIQPWVKDFDIVVYPSFYVQRKDLPKDLISSNVIKKYGTEYVLLNERKNNNKTTKNAFKTLITFGGSDPNNITESIASYVKNRHDYGDFSFLIGPKFKHSAEYFRNKFTNLNFIDSIEGTSELIEGSELVITAVGTTLQECEFFNVKTLIVSNYEDDIIDIGRIKRSSSEPSMFHFINYYQNINEVSFNTSYNYLCNKNIKNLDKKNDWGIGWNKLLGINE